MEQVTKKLITIPEPVQGPEHDGETLKIELSTLVAFLATHAPKLDTFMGSRACTKVLDALEVAADGVATVSDEHLEPLCEALKDPETPKFGLPVTIKDPETGEAKQGTWIPKQIGLAGLVAALLDAKDITPAVEAEE